MKNFEVQKKPVRIPGVGEKIIEEHFGKASVCPGDYSFAHMIAPPKWEEPFQTPEFDEITYMISGKLFIELENGNITLDKNQSICIKKGTRVKYSNPFGSTAEYVSVCIPAFTAALANREE